jgi:broad specificity phosphatase PhoE
MKAFFVRHGESLYNVKRLCNADPRIDVPLTAHGIRQAQVARARLAAKSLEAIYVSELPRARQTAEIIRRDHACPMIVDARLNDRRSGFEGRPIDEYLAAAASDPLHFCAPGGESYLDLKMRVIAFLEELAQFDAGAVAVVTHHEVLQIVKGTLENFDDPDMWRIRVEPGAILAYEFDGSNRVRRGSG